MATVDRIHSGYPAWTPSAPELPAADERYVGKHRKPEMWRILSLVRYFYVGRHRALTN
jgi:hypothetical protein